MASSQKRLGANSNEEHDLPCWVLQGPFVAGTRWGDLPEAWQERLGGASLNLNFYLLCTLVVSVAVWTVPSRLPYM